MGREYLGIFDTPPDKREILLSLAIVGLLFATLFVALPLRDRQLGEISAFIPLIDATMLFSELIIASLLYAQAAVFRSKALIILASGYLFAALLLVPHALTFPGAFSETGLLGAGINTTAWLAVFRRFAFPIAVISYALIKSAELMASPDSERPAARVIQGAASAIALAAFGTILAIAGQDFLPPIFANSRDTLRANLVMVNAGTIVFTITAMVLLLRQTKSVLDIWLLVALSGWIFQSLLNLSLHTRYTIGWYGLNVMTVAASFVVMLALFGESIRLYSRLALSFAARERERDARLMALDAVTAAISHEVGQPLAAVGLGASAGLRWLKGEQPNVEKAIVALQEVSDARKRTFDVIRSIRSMFATGAGQTTEFSLNELVIETAALLDRELAANKVSVNLFLDDILPPIRGDRVQIQRVLMNLLVNATESLSEISDRPRRVEIRSELLSNGAVQLQISDTGIGFASEDVEQIFDAFFTTKATGTGLGLPLCRTIVEDHGGRLWASRREPYGANFHLRLPRSDAGAGTVEETDRLLTKLEGSLRWLRQSKSGEASKVIDELQNVVEDVRKGMKRDV